MISLSGGLPAPLLLGVRLLARRPRRLLLTVFSMAITAAGLVLVMIFRAAKSGWSLSPGVTQATTVISVMLILLAGVNAVSSPGRPRSKSTPRRACPGPWGHARAHTIGLSVAQLLPALIGALLGIRARDRYLRRRQKWPRDGDAPPRR